MTSSNQSYEESLLLSVEGVTEFYANLHETVVGTFFIYLVTIPKGNYHGGLNTETDNSYLHIALPSAHNFALSPSTIITRKSDSAYTIKTDDLTVNIDLLDPVTGDTHGRYKELVIDDADSLEAIFSRFSLLGPRSDPNSLILVDNVNGEEIAALPNMTFTEVPNLSHDSSPVELIIDQETHQVTVQPISAETAQAASTSEPAFTPLVYDKDDRIMSTAVGMSNTLVFVSNKVSSGLGSTADWWERNRPATEKPVVFKDSTKNYIRRTSQVTETGARYSRKTVEFVSDAAANLGAKMASSKKGKSDGDDKPKGLISRSFIAFSTVMDGIDTSSQTVIKGVSNSSSRIIGHSYGAEAGEVAGNFGRSLTNCTMIYIDARGISRKAVVKGIGKGYIKKRYGHSNSNNTTVVGEQQPQSPGEKEAYDSKQSNPSISNDGGSSFYAMSAAPSLPARPPSQSGFLQAAHHTPTPPPYAQEPSNTTAQTSYSDQPNYYGQH